MDSNIDPLLRHFSGVPEEWTIRISPNPNLQIEPPIPNEPDIYLRNLAQDGIPCPGFPPEVSHSDEEPQAYVDQYSMYHPSHHAAHMTAGSTGEGNLNQEPNFDEVQGYLTTKSNIAPIIESDHAGMDLDAYAPINTKEPMQIDCIDPQRLMYYNPLPAITPKHRSFFSTENDNAKPETEPETESEPDYEPKPGNQYVFVEYTPEQTSEQEEPSRTPPPVVPKSRKHLPKFDAEKPNWNVYKCNHPGCEYRNRCLYLVVKHARRAKSHDNDEVTISWIGNERVQNAITFVPGETLNERRERLKREHIEIGKQWMNRFLSPSS